MGIKYLTDLTKTELYAFTQGTDKNKYVPT